MLSCLLCHYAVRLWDISEWLVGWLSSIFVASRLKYVEIIEKCCPGIEVMRILFSTFYVLYSKVFIQKGAYTTRYLYSKVFIQ